VVGCSVHATIECTPPRRGNAEKDTDTDKEKDTETGTETETETATEPENRNTFNSFEPFVLGLPLKMCSGACLSLGYK